MRFRRRQVQKKKILVDGKTKGGLHILAYEDERELDFRKRFEVLVDDRPVEFYAGKRRDGKDGTLASSKIVTEFGELFTYRAAGEEPRDTWKPKGSRIPEPITRSGA